MRRVSHQHSGCQHAYSGMFMRLQAIAVVVVLAACHGARAGATSQVEQRLRAAKERHHYKKGGNVSMDAGPPSPPGECDPSAANVCSNHGTCVKRTRPGHSFPSFYVCKCSDMIWAGPQCDQCLCEPDGSCVNEVGRGWLCNYTKCSKNPNLDPASQCVYCKKGYYGPVCEECPGGAETPCSNHGTCDGSGTNKGSGMCDCDIGWNGTICNSSMPIPSPAPSPAVDPLPVNFLSKKQLVIIAGVLGGLFLVVVVVSSVRYVLGKNNKARGNDNSNTDRLLDFVGHNYMDDDLLDDYSPSGSVNSNRPMSLLRYLKYNDRWSREGSMTSPDSSMASDTRTSRGDLEAVFATALAQQRKSSGGDNPNSPLSPLKSGDWTIDLDQIILEERIGEGGSSQVYRATYAGFSVAVKVMEIPQNARNSVARDEFRKEAELLARLHHRHIVRFYGVSFSPGNTTLLMVEEHCPSALSDLLSYRPADDHRKQALPRLDILKMAMQLASGMYFLHTKRVVHRDLKPENVLLDDKQVIKICDFGVARGFVDATSEMTMTGQIGTPVYMAPEILSGSRAKYGPDPTKVDVFSFGILLWTLCTRRPPYREMIFQQGYNAFQLASRVMQGFRPGDDEVEIEKEKEIEMHEEMRGSKEPSTPDGKEGDAEAAGGTLVEDSRKDQDDDLVCIPTWSKTSSIPSDIRTVMTKCWAAHPSARPSFEELFTTLEAMYMKEKKGDETA